MALCCVTPAKGLDVSAHSAILMDADTGTVLFEKNPDEKSLIASTTKIMTALVTLEQGQLQDVVEIPHAAVGIEGSSMYLKAGEQLTVEDLLHGMMLSSGNDAAVALALHISGSVEAFAAKMNEKAAELGLNCAHFANPNGLDSEENYATARDLAVLAAAALKNPDFRRIVSTKSYRCSGHSMTNHNKLLWQYEGAMGVKTGFTKKAGRILVGSAEQKGRTLISVTINAPNDWQDHKSMLDHGFSQYEEVIAVKKGSQIGIMPVISGVKENVALMAGEGISCWLLPEEKTELRLYLPRFVYAPVEGGAEIGTGEVYLGEKLLGTIPVYTQEDVAQIPETPGFWDRILHKDLKFQGRTASARYITWGGKSCAGTCSKDSGGLRNCITAQSGRADPPGTGSRW